MTKVGNYVARSTKKPFFMTNIFEIISSAFSSPSPLLKNSEEEAKRALRRIVSSRTHGNVHIQLGNYCTQGDIDARKEKLKNYSFI